MVTKPVEVKIAKPKQELKVVASEELMIITKIDSQDGT